MPCTVQLSEPERQRGLSGSRGLAPAVLLSVYRSQRIESEPERCRSRLRAAMGSNRTTEGPPTPISPRGLRQRFCILVLEPRTQNPEPIS